MNDTRDPLAVLKTDAEQGVAYCYTRAMIWWVVYLVTRGSLIIFSALTSAQAAEVILFAKSWQPLFAVLVTIIAAFDSWLKPGEKYKALYMANDEYNQLRQEMEFVDTTSKEKIVGLLETYKQIGVRLRQSVAP